MPFLNPKLGIDFSNYIADRTLNFTGRGWVFEAIQNWLANPKDDRFFLLTGEPGSGKTAIAARLAQFAQGAENCCETKDYPEIDAGFLHAVFFCSAQESTWTSPLEFSRTLAMQLAQSIPEFALALKDIGGKTVNIDANITVGSAESSTLQAVVVQNLSIQGLSGQDAFDQVVVNPLRQIRGEGFSQPVTILVDSLDEALTHDKDIQNTIVNLLSKLSKDAGVRLILTSRNEGKVKGEFIKIAYEELFLSSPENLERNEQDIQKYIDEQFRREEKLLNSLQIESLDQKTLTTKLIKKSEGNFLYVRFLLESVALGQQSFANLDGLPQGLNELYYDSLGRVVKLGKKDWSEVYAPVMGVLLAAQESLTERQIRAFTKLKESVVWDCLNDLQQFLDEIESEDEETLYKLYHQSVTDFLGKRQLVIYKQKLNNHYFLSGQEQHQRLLTYYRPEDKTWNEVQLEKIDPYGRRYLAQHLVKADRAEELHTLLSLEKDGKNAWFKLKDDEGDTAGFLADIELAWSQADKAYGHEPGKSIGLQCRYALIRTSINSLAKIPTKLMIAFIKHPNPYWQPKKALTYVRQISDSKIRAKSLTELAEHMPKPLRQEVLQTALQATSEIQKEEDRYWALGELVRFKLPSELLPQALKIAQAFDRKSTRTLALTNLIEQLPDIYSLALDAARLMIQSDPSYVYVEVLKLLADELPEGLPEDLKATLDKYSDQLEPDGNMDWVIESIEEKESYQHAWAVKALGDKPSDTFPKLLQAIEVEDYQNKDYKLEALADQLTPTLLPQALEAVKALQNKKYRAEVLAALASKLTPEDFPKAQEVAQAIQDEYHCALALINLADELPALLTKTLELIQVIKDKYHRALVLISLGDILPTWLTETLELIQVIKDEDCRGLALRKLACKLPKLPSQTLEILQTIRNSEIRSYVLVNIIDKLPQELLPKVLEAIQNIDEDRDRCDVLIGLIITENLPTHLLPKILEATWKIDKHWRDNVLIELVDKLMPEFFPLALKAAEMIQDPFKRAQKLTVLAEKTPELLPKAIEVAQAIEYGTSCIEALTALTIQAIQIDRYRDEALKALGKSYSATLKDSESPQDYDSKFMDLMDMTSSFEAIKYSRFQVFMALANKIPTLLPQAAETIRDMKDHENRFRAVMALKDMSPELDHEPFLETAFELAKNFNSSLSNIELLVTRVDELPKLLPIALEKAQAIEDHEKCILLMALAEKLAPELLPKALELLKTIQSDQSRSVALSALADKLKLTPELLSEALELLKTIQTDEYRSEALRILSSNLVNNPKLEMLWKDLLHFFSYQTRPSLLSDIASLTSVIDALGGKVAIAETAQAIEDIAQWWR